MEEIKVGVDEKKKTQGMRRDLGHKGCGRSHHPELARRKILCKRFSTKSRVALESGADSGLDPLVTESHGGQNGMRAGTA